MHTGSHSRWSAAKMTVDVETRELLDARGSIASKTGKKSVLASCKILENQEHSRIEA